MIGNNGVSRGVAKSLDWWSGKVFNFVHSNNLIYNACWEDPRLDRVALDIKSDDNIMMITSAGCNALDYALENPNHIYAIDMNPRQNALLDLKIAGIKKLDYETFFALFGEGYHEDWQRIYKSELRPLLSDESKFHWDKKDNYFTGAKFRPSFYYRGSTGVLAHMVRGYASLTQIKQDMLSLFDAASLEEQKQMYYDLVQGMLFNDFIRWMFRRDAFLSLAGVPRPQREQIDQTYAGGIGHFVEDCVETVCTKLSLKDNYFWWLYVNGQYTKERCPRYLQRDYFQQLKDGAVDSISTHTTTILDFLRNHTGSISKYVLLDHMDWLSTYNQPVLHKEWQAIVDKGSVNSRAIWRSGGLKVDFVDPIEVNRGKDKTELGNILNYNFDLANELHVKDRVHTYGSFYIANFEGQTCH